MDIKWTGTLPDVTAEPDFTDMMKDASEYTYASVMTTLRVGGRPDSWVPKADGSKSFLLGTGPNGGALHASIRAESTPTSFKVSTNKGEIPYCFIHQFGGWAGRGHKSHIPARPYMIFQKEDREHIQAMFGDAVVKLFQTKRRPVGTQS